MIRFDNLPPEVIQAMCTPMHQVLVPAALPPSPSAPHGAQTGSLYIGSLSAVQDPALLRANHITHLVQVLDVPWLPLSEQDGFNCYRIPIMDERSADIRPHLEGVCAHIDSALRAGRSVLVHCQQVSLLFIAVPRHSAILRAGVAPPGLSLVPACLSTRHSHLAFVF